jgi:predicted transcriptional regulator
VSTKDAILELIRKLPDDVTLADIMAELYFRQKVDQGLSELDAGKGVPHEQARERLQKWLK